jgi:hypothetical protein
VLELKEVNPITGLLMIIQILLHLIQKEINKAADKVLVTKIIQKLLIQQSHLQVI